MAGAVRLASRRLDRWNGPRLLELAALPGVIGAAGFLYLQVGGYPLLAMVALIAVTLVVFWMGFSTRYEISLAVLAAYLLLADGYLKLRFQGQLSLLGRDLLLLSITLGAFVRWVMSRTEFRLPPLTGWVAAWCIAVLVQLANPENGTFQHSVLALRPHIEFVPLFFFGYACMRTSGRLKGFMWLLLALTAVNGVVGYIQSTLTPDELAEWGPGYADRVHGVEGGVSPRGFYDDSGERRVRPFALGSDQGFGGALGVLAAPAALAAIILGRGRWLAISVALAAAVAVAVITSQARISLLTSVLAVALFLLFGSTARTRWWLVGAATAGAVITTLAVSSIAGGLDEGIFDRYESIAPNQVVNTAFEYRRDTIATIPTYLADFPLGAGIGTVGPGSSTPGGNGKVLNGESEFTFLIIEVGVVGLLVLTAFNLRLIQLLFTRLRRLEPEVRLLVAAFGAPLVAKFASWVGGPTTASTPDAPYLWFVAGVLGWWLVASPAQVATVARD